MLQSHNHSILWSLTLYFYMMLLAHWYRPQWTEHQNVFCLCSDMLHNISASVYLIVFWINLFRKCMCIYVPIQDLRGKRGGTWTFQMSYYKANDPTLQLRFERILKIKFRPLPSFVVDDAIWSSVIKTLTDLWWKPTHLISHSISVQ